MSDRIIAACDGAAKKNPGPAAWAWVVADADGTPRRWEAGPLGSTTNNVAELTALAELLQATDPAVPLEVRIDSQYAMNAVTKWIAGWKRNGWKTSAGKPVANRELVVRIDALLAGREVEFRHVAAHRVDGDPLNAIADAAASEAAETQRPAGTSHGTPEVPTPRPAEPDRASGAAQASNASKAPKAPKTPGASAGKPAGKRTGGTIKARYPGRCRCGRSYQAGEKIAKNPDGWGHPDCRTGSGQPA